MSATKTAYKCFIGGEWVDAASGETMEVINPATGEMIAEVPKCGAEDVDRGGRGREEGAAETGSTRRRRSARSCCSSSPTSSTRTPRSSRSSSR